MIPPINANLDSLPHSDGLITKTIKAVPFENFI